MIERVEQRYGISFARSLEIPKQKQSGRFIRLSATQIKEWFNRIKDGRTLADSDQHSGRPSTSRNANVIENVASLILEDRHLTV
jgi:hypothetical protein